MTSHQMQASFRDPCGFMFEYGHRFYRQVNQQYQADYDQLMASGLYRTLVERNWLVRHEEVSDPRPEANDSDQVYRILEPVQVGYISYPYEWCFSELKDAALLTLDIQAEALKHGMTLKDASAYNIQFVDGRPLFIDTLSFECFTKGSPWIAYRQFCQHFLGPLALICHCDYRLSQLLRTCIDGIPLDLVSRLLPRRTWLNYSLLAHVHLHAKTQKHFEDTGRSEQATKPTHVSEAQLEGLLSSVQRATTRLNWRYAGTEWGDYYQDTNYVDEAMQHKEEVVTDFLNRCKLSEYSRVADFGANTGRFSRLAAKLGCQVISHDIDHVAVDKNYLSGRDKAEQNILPLVLDLTNPSPALGWALAERDSFVDRQQMDLGMALALIHHIALSNNVPLAAISDLFSQMCNQLIIEFVPKSDSQVRRLLATREDIFPDYHQQGFEQAFEFDFRIEDSVTISGTDRRIYLMQSRHNPSVED